MWSKIATIAPPAHSPPQQMCSPHPDVFARPEPAGEPVFEPGRDEQAFDLARIMASIGEVAYEWSIGSDGLAWGRNATDVLTVGSLAAISSGRNYAKLLAADAAASRFDAVMKSSQRDEGTGVPYQVQYKLQPPGQGKSLWIEDIGRWFADVDGRPARAHGVVRVINERHDEEERLTYLSRFDGLTGEMNRFHLTEVLESTLKQAVAQRTSCGFMLVAIDNLARINESYGFEVADEAIGAVAKRLRTKMRGGDQLGRFSGNKFGIILNNCTPEDMEKAAERLIAGVRDDVVRTRGGPVAVTVTIGGVTAPRYASNVQEILARDAGNARPRQDQAARLVPGLSAERRARDAAPRERACRRRDRHRAQRAANSSGVRAGGRGRDTADGVLRMPDAHPAHRRLAGAGERGEPCGGAAWSRPAARPSRAGATGGRDGCGSGA